MTPDIGDHALRQCDNEALAVRMQQFYAELDDAIAERAPVCTNRGLCCNFDAYGHDLFVTAVELSCFIQGHRKDWRQPGDARVCPWQVGGRCEARTHRPLGCRVFFCDESSRDWQSAEYEKRLAELKAIGAAHGVEYRYVEWLSALRSVPPAGVQCTASGSAPRPVAQFVDPRRLPVIESN